MKIQRSSNLRWLFGVIPMVLFGLPFFGLGSFFAIVGVWGLLFPGPGTGDTASMIITTVMGSIFMLIGGGIMFGAFFSTHGRKVGPQGKPMPIGRTPDEYVIFPKARIRGRGQRLGAILKPVMTRGATFIAFIVAAIVWNGIAWSAVWAVMTQDKGAPIFAKTMVLLLGLTGFYIIALMIQHGLRMMTWKGTRVEVQKELIAPGETTRLSVTQPGSFPIEYLKLTIISRESATFRRGTKTRTETQDLWSREILHLTNLTAAESRPIAETTIEIPAEAMHSFVSSNNKLLWIIRLEMDGPRRFRIEEEYSIRVAPQVNR